MISYGSLVCLRSPLAVKCCQFRNQLSAFRTGEPYDQIYQVLEYIFTVIFALEMVIKMVRCSADRVQIPVESLVAQLFLGCA